MLMPSHAEVVLNNSEQEGIKVFRDIPTLG